MAPIFSGCAMSHGYERLEKCEAGELRPRSKITWLTWHSDRTVLSSKHSLRKMNKNHIEMWSASLPTNYSSRHQCSSWTMTLNWNLDLESLTINYERYWFEWEHTVELPCLILGAINYELCLSKNCINSCRRMARVSTFPIKIELAIKYLVKSLRLVT